MTERLGESQLKAISIPEVRRYLLSHGFVTRGPWGKFLERFKSETDQGQFDVIVPTTRDIADFESRISDALRDLSVAVGVSVSEVLNAVIISDHKVFRLRAYAGQEISSIPFDEGFGLLTNAKQIIKSSAVTAFSSKKIKLIRGRYPVAVDDYMDNVRLGQSEIGSYIFNLLLPRSDGIMEYNSGYDDSSDAVVEIISEGMILAEEVSRNNRVPSESKIEESGISANFFEALYNIVEYSGKVSIEVGGPVSSHINGIRAFHFNESSLRVLERTALKIAPENRTVVKKVSGTITRLSEPASTRRGSIDLLARIDGRKRSVRINFGPNDREEIILAFKEKDSRLLTVTGQLKTERNGHLTLENAHGFDASKRGTLL